MSLLGLSEMRFYLKIMLLDGKQCCIPHSVCMYVTVFVRVSFSVCLCMCLCV